MQIKDTVMHDAWQITIFATLQFYKNISEITYLMNDLYSFDKSRDLVPTFTKSELPWHSTPSEGAHITRDKAIDRLKKSETELKRAGVTHLYLFGSTARDEARPGSDVDLFFDYDREDFGIFALMDVKELTSRILDSKTDMIPRDGLHHVLRARIEASAVQIF